MSAHSPASHSSSEHAGTPRLFVWVWIWLVAITGIEVYLAYLQLEPKLMLALLLGLSVTKAALIMSYFMHLRFERLSLVLWLVPGLVTCICLMSIFFPDGVRALQMRP